MYEIPGIGDLLSQGDIFRARFIFPYSPSPDEDFQIVRGDQLLSHGQVPDAWLGGSEAVLVPSFSSNFGIVLSNSCDAETVGAKDPLEFISIDAIFPLTALPNDGKRGDCRKNRFIRYHYLDARPVIDFPESYVHFGLSALVRQESLLRLKNSRVLSLASPFRESLGHRLGEFYARVALP